MLKYVEMGGDGGCLELGWDQLDCWRIGWVNIQNRNAIDGVQAIHMLQEIDRLEAFDDLSWIYLGPFYILWASSSTQIDPAIDPALGVHLTHLWRIASSWPWRPPFDGPRHLR